MASSCCKQVSRVACSEQLFCPRFLNQLATTFVVRVTRDPKYLKLVVVVMMEVLEMNKMMKGIRKKTPDSHSELKDFAYKFKTIYRR